MLPVFRARFSRTVVEPEILRDENKIQKLLTIINNYYLAISNFRIEVAMGAIKKVKVQIKIYLYFSIYYKSKNYNNEAHDIIKQ